MINADMPIHGEFKQAGDQAIKKGGMTLRQHYAGLAMQGLMSNGYIDPEMWGAKRIADLSIEAADALLAALDQ